MTIKIIPYKCVCGANIKYIEKHYKTKKHQMFIKKINNTKLPEISTEQKYIIDSIQYNNVISIPTIYISLSHIFSKHYNIHWLILI